MIYTPAALRSDDGDVVMRSITSLPPNYARLLKAFPHIRFRRGMLFAFGERLYNPDQVMLTPELWEHEYTHQRQQAQLGTSDAWWNLYIEDVDFRFAMEHEAHMREIAALRERLKGKKLRRAVAEVYARMLSPIYRFRPDQLETLDAAPSLAPGAESSAELEETGPVEYGDGGAPWPREPREGAEVVECLFPAGGNEAAEGK